MNCVTLFLAGHKIVCIKLAPVMSLVLWFSSRLASHHGGGENHLDSFLLRQTHKTWYLQIPLLYRHLSISFSLMVNSEMSSQTLNLDLRFKHVSDIIMLDDQIHPSDDNDDARIDFGSHSNNLLRLTETSSFSAVAEVQTEWWLSNRNACCSCWTQNLSNQKSGREKSLSWMLSLLPWKQCGFIGAQRDVEGSDLCIGSGSLGLRKVWQGAGRSLHQCQVITSPSSTNILYLTIFCILFLLYHWFFPFGTEFSNCATEYFSWSISDLQDLAF